MGFKPAGPNSAPITGLVDPAARAQFRRRHKSGLAWSPLNPGLLEANEPLPVVAVDRPPLSPAILTPFPLRREKLPRQGGAELDAEWLADEKISWCYGERRGFGQAIKKRVQALMAYYEPRPIVGERYFWLKLNPETCPYLPLLRLVLPALAPYACAAGPASAVDEAWRTAAPDDFGVAAHLAATDLESAVVFSLSLTGPTLALGQDYKMPRRRWEFFRQQFLFLLGSRLQPYSVRGGQGSWRGMIYKKPAGH